MPLISSPCRTIIAIDKHALITWLGALRRACEDATLRADAAEFLRRTADLPENVAVYADRQGLGLLVDDQGELLAWYPHES
jgi:hypothetical protein